MPAGRRLASIDALRGLAVAAMLLVNNPGDWAHVYAPLRHADWYGCTPTDLIFPLFLFIVGVSLAFALGPERECRDRLSRQRRAVVLRAARIVALGLGLHLCAWLLLQQDYFRPWGVLQRIGLCFGIVALLAIHTRSGIHWLLMAGLLAGYALLLAAGGTEPLINPVSRIDTALFAPYLYQFDPVSGRGHDPEGLLSTVPAIVTTLLGLRIGVWLREGEAWRVLTAAVVLLALGWLWSWWLPWNKHLWTPSYVLWTGGWASVLLWGAHQLIDRRGWPPLGRSFGINAIVAYAGSALMVYVLIATGGWAAGYRHLAAWLTPWAGPHLASLAYAVVFLAFWWLLMRWFERRGWRITI